MDLNSLRTGRDVQKYQRILHLPEEAKASLDFKTLKQSLIAENIFSYGLSESHFVLIVSNSQTYKSIVTVWRIGEEVTFSYSLTPSSHPLHPLTSLCLLSSEDLLLHGSLLILMASPVGPSNFFNESQPLTSDLLHVFDLSQPPLAPGFLAGRHALPAPWLRLLPPVLKAGGGPRLRADGHLLLAVCPLVQATHYTTDHALAQANITLKLFSLSPLQEELEMLWEHTVPDTSPLLPLSYLACDQKGPSLVLSFSRSCEQQPLSQQFLTLSLAAPSPSLRVHRAPTMPRVPRLLETEGRREECLVAVGEQQGVFATLDAAGLVTVANSAGIYRQFFPVYGVSDDFDTFYDELHIYNGLLVLLKIFQNRELGLGNKRSLVVVGSLQGEVLWRAGTAVGGERLYLAPMLHNLLLSSARGATVYGLRTGEVKAVIHYPRYKRQSRELESGDPQVSPYAQTGFSVWELRRLGDRVAVVHDMERVNPVLLDLIHLS